MPSCISSKGQITVPIEIRRALGLRAGTRVRFELSGNTAVLHKEAPTDHPVDRVFGLVKTPRTTEQLLEEVRGARPDGD